MTKSIPKRLTAAFAAAVTLIAAVPWSPGGGWIKEETVSAANSTLTSGTNKSLSTGTYYLTSDVTCTSTSRSYGGLSISGDVVIDLNGYTLNATGSAGSGTSGGSPGIYLPSGSTLTLVGVGKVTATGGKAANGSSGGSGGVGAIQKSPDKWKGGAGGDGGSGGGGAGAGIGTFGGSGGSGGSGCSTSLYDCKKNSGAAGGRGGSGSSGSSASAPGELRIFGGITVSATGGSSGSGGSAGSAGSKHLIDDNTGWDNEYSAGAGGGGGGGGGGGQAMGYGYGGGGGGGGGGGASGTTYCDTGSGTYWRIYYGQGGSGGSGGTGNGSSGSSGSENPSTVESPWGIDSDHVGNWSTSAGTSGGSGGSNGGGPTTGLRYKQYSNASVLSASGYGGNSSVSFNTVSGSSGTVTLNYNFTKRPSCNPVNTTSVGGNTVNVSALSMSTANFQTMTGYTLEGYYSSAEDGSKVVNANGTFVSGTVNGYIDGGRWNAAAPRTLYANWTPNVYKLYLDADNGKGGMTTTVTYDDSNYHMGKTAPSRTGYKFMGYYTQKKGQGIQYFDEEMQPTQDQWNIPRETRLYAYWEPLQYTINFYSNLDDGEGPIWAFATPEKGVTYGQMNLDGVDSIPTQLRKPNYTFVGWNIYDQQDWAMYQAGKDYQVGLCDEEGNDVSLFAAWKENEKFTIAYSANGGRGEPASQTVYINNDAELSDTIPKRDDYTFLGWSTDPEAEEPEYAAGGTIPDIQTSYVLYAIWQKNPEVTYEPNGGSFNLFVPAAYPEKNKDYTLTKVVPVRDGYNFIGWTIDEAGEGTKYQAGATFRMPDSLDPITFYAQWEVKKYNVTINGDVPEGINADTSFTRQYEINEEVSFTAEVTTENTILRIFANGKPLTKDENGNYTFTVTQDTEVRFVTSDDSHHVVSYDPNGGTGLPVDVNLYAENDTVTVNNVTTPTKTGYTFAGWSDGTTTYAKGASFTMGTADVVLTAEWTPITYTVSFNGGNDVSGSTTSQTLTYDAAETLTANGFAKTGFAFKGWSDEENGSVILQDKASVKNLSDTQDAEYKLYAVWEPAMTKITLDPTGGLLNMNLDYIYAVYNTSLPDSIAAPTRDGYIFGGYYTLENGNGSQIYDADMKATADYSTWTKTDETMTVYAKWTPINYSIELYDGETKLNYSEWTNIPYNKEVNLANVKALLEIPEGKYLAGWSPWANSASAFYEPDQVLDSGLTVNDGDTVKLYAVILEKDSYTVTYDANGGSNAPVDSARYYVDSTVIVKFSQKPVRTGYTFLGWALDPDAEAPDYPADGTSQTFTMGTDHITLFAVWEANTYTVSYEPNAEDVTGTISAQTFTYDLSDTLSDGSGFTREGYIFTGWSDTEGGSDVAYAGGMRVTNLTETADDTLTLYAVWTPETYTVTYDANGGDNKPTDANIYERNDWIIVNFTQTPSRQGYEFLGWTTDSYYDAETSVLYDYQAYLADAAEGNDTDTIYGFKAVEDVTFYAVWKKSSAPVIDAISDQTFTGTAIEPDLHITVQTTGGVVTLEKDTDYSVAYLYNTAVGTASAIVTYLGDYSQYGAAYKTFLIVAGEDALVIDDIADQTYDGTAKTPALTVTSCGTALKLNKDYTATYTENINAGTATVTVRGISDTYMGLLATKEFQIQKGEHIVTFYAEGKQSVSFDEKRFSNTAKSNFGAAVTYSIAEGDAATIDAKTGVVTARSFGTVTVKATAEGDGQNYDTASATYELTFTKSNGRIYFEKEMIQADYSDAIANALNNIGDGIVTYSSSDPSVVSVDSKTGKVTIRSCGTAIITATVADGTNYTYAEKEASYTVIVESDAILYTASGYHGVYDQKEHSISVDITQPTDAVITYSTEKDGTYTEQAPAFSDVGTYTVYYRITAPAYSDVEGSATVVIDAAELSSAAFSDAVYTGEEIVPEVQVKVGALTVPADGYTVIYPVQHLTETGYYTAYVQGIGNYKGIVIGTFRITQAENTISETEMQGWIYGETPVEPKASATFGTVEYWYEGTGDTEYALTQDAPSEAGTYQVTAKVPGTANYTSAEAVPAAFTIEVAENSISETEMQGWIYGETPVEPKASATFGTVEYWYEGTGDTEYALTQDAPSEAGTYQVTAKVPGTANYTSAEAVPAAFTIEKVMVEIPVVSDFLYNGQPQRADIEDTDVYRVIKNDGGILFGTYTAELELIDPKNYVWSNGSSDAVTLSYEITYVENTIPVTDITDVPSAAISGEIVTLGGTVVPGDATYQTIIWSMADANGQAELSGDQFLAKNAGKYTLTATILGGAGKGESYTKDFVIAVNNPVISINNVTISAQVGAEMSATMAVKFINVKLSDQVTAGTNFSSWLNLPAGLHAAVASRTDNMVYIQISGTPLEKSSDQIVLQIPSEQLLNSDGTAHPQIPVQVVDNPYAKWNITEAVTTTVTTDVTTTTTTITTSVSAEESTDVTTDISHATTQDTETTTSAQETSTVTTVSSVSGQTSVGPTQTTTEGTETVTTVSSVSGQTSVGPTQTTTEGTETVTTVSSVSGQTSIGPTQTTTEGTETVTTVSSVSGQTSIGPTQTTTDGTSNTTSSGQTQSGTTTDTTATTVIKLQPNEKQTETVGIGDTVQLEVPTAAGNPKWTSSNPDIASVDENGVVTIIGEGEVTIIAVGEDGNTYEVTFTAEPETTSTSASTASSSTSTGTSTQTTTSSIGTSTSASASGSVSSDKQTQTTTTTDGTKTSATVSTGSDSTTSVSTATSGLTGTTGDTNSSTAGSETTLTSTSDTTTESTATSESSTTTTDTTSEGTAPALSAETKSEAMYYFSADTRSFDPAELLTVYAADEEGQQVDVTEHVVFEYATPAEMYAAVGAAYTAQELTAYYADPDTGEKTELDVKPMVYIGMKGDSNMDGNITPDDAYLTLVYYAQCSVGKDPLFTTGEDQNLEKLAYFLTDVDQEVILGEDNDKTSISPDDAYYILVYYASHSVGKDIAWSEVIPSLKTLEGSMWAS